jgi:hypothetical protein
LEEIMDGHDVAYIVLGLAAIACIAFVVWWGGRIRARRRPDGTVEVHATGRQPPGRVEVGEEATVDRAGTVDMSGVDAPAGTAERAAAGGATVGKRRKLAIAIRSALPV